MVKSHYENFLLDQGLVMVLAHLRIAAFLILYLYWSGPKGKYWVQWSICCLVVNKALRRMVLCLVPGPKGVLVYLVPGSDLDKVIKVVLSSQVQT